MATRKKEPKAALYIGVSEKAVSATVKGIKEIFALKNVSDGLKLEAMRTLAATSRAPSGLSVHGCHFESR